MLPHWMTTPSHVIIIQTLLNLSLAVTQAEKQLTSKNTTYAELQGSLITQEEENLVL